VARFETTDDCGCQRVGLAPAAASFAEDGDPCHHPHPGEAARLLNSTAKEVQSNRPQALREISKRLGNCWVVLKGNQTLIAGVQAKFL